MDAQRGQTLAGDYGQAPKSTFVRAHQLRGRHAYLMEIGQPPGGYGSPACAELTFVMPQSPRIRLSKRWGAARFEGLAPARSIWLVPPDTSTELEIRDPHVIRTASISAGFLAARLDGLDQAIDFDRLHRTPLTNGAVGTLFGALWEAASPTSPHGALFVDHVLNAVVLELTTLSDRRPPRTQGGLAPWQIRRVTDCLAQSDDETLSLASLAGLVGLSPFHFARMFKQSMGMAPHRYQRHVRLERARQRLHERDTSITAIAHEAGYESSQAFARAFREAYALSPTDYRRQRLT